MSARQFTSLAFRDHLKVENGRLTIDGIPCERLAHEFGTPLYVISESRIRENYRAFRGELAGLYEDVLVCPAYKANSHLAVCRIYQTEGAGAEVVSPIELKMALDSGVPPQKIVYNGPVKTEHDLEFAISSGVGLINADSVPELDRMQKVAQRINKQCNVGIRINLGIGAETHPHLATAQREHKFGAWVGDAASAYRTAAKKPALNVIGVHCHVGSNITQPEVFREMTDAILQLVKQVEDEAGLKLTKIDVGGGLGFPYRHDSPLMTRLDYASAILGQNRAMLERLGRPTLIFEPGRTIIADAGILLTRVEVVKRQGNKNWAIVDAGMNTFLRPALYGAKHQVIDAGHASEAATSYYNIGGPCCESGDVIGTDVTLPPLAERDLLAVLDVGAYGFTMSSNYNGQPRAAVALVKDERCDLIRKRENYEDLVAAEIIPSHLKAI